MNVPVATDNSTSVAALVTDLGGTGVKPLTQMEWERLRLGLQQAMISPAVLPGRSERQLRDMGLGETTVDRIRALAAGSGAVAFRLSQLANQGIWAASRYDEGFPSRFAEILGKYCPPIVFGTGDLNLCTATSVGVVGSRDVAPEGFAVAAQIGERAAAESVGVVSGGARGVDSAAMNGAAEAGGRVVGIVSDSLGSATRRRSTRELIRSGRALLLSPNPPDTRFSIGRVKARDKLIYALSDATVVVATTEGKGGTWGGATEALKRGFGRVFVWMGDGRGEGNAALVEGGGTPAHSIDDAFRMLKNPASVPEPSEEAPQPEQQVLDLGGP